MKVSQILKELNWFVIALTTVLLGAGLVNLYSASGAFFSGVFFKQLVWIAIGIFIMALALIIDYRVLMKLAWPFYILVIILLFAVFGFGKQIQGARRWFDLGPIHLQPSELAKIAIILWVSYFSTTKKHDLPYSFIELIKPIAVVALPILLILLEPDLGTAGIAIFIATGMILMLGINGKTLIALAVLCSSAMPAGWFILKDYQRQRILTFIDPSRDPQGSGYHAIQSKIAVGSGMLSGKGFMHGTQTQLKFLPEHHTDFIFSVVAEEWGFIGSAVIIILFLMLIMNIISVGLNAKDRFGAMLCFGIALYFSFHVFINVAMTMGLFPVVGVPLPFISYGGSFILICLSCIGIVLNVSWRKYFF